MIEQDTTVEVPLTHGQTAVVDGEHAKAFSGHNWYAKKTSKYGVYYAWTQMYDGTVRKQVYMHRYIWEYVVGNIPKGMEIDHINGNGLDNRIENLRVVTRRQNTQNNRARREYKTSSIFPGVYWHNKSGRWIPAIFVGNKNYYLGSFESEWEASEAYQKALARFEGCIETTSEGASIWYDDIKNPLCIISSDTLSKIDEFSLAHPSISPDFLSKELNITINELLFRMSREFEGDV